eukprot:scpid94587/ scgid25979/ 
MMGEAQASQALFQASQAQAGQDITDKDSPFHISKWTTKEIAQKSLVNFLCDHISYEEMRLLADVALGKGVLNSGQKSVDNNFRTSQDRSPKTWLATMISLWATQEPGNES